VRTGLRATRNPAAAGEQPHASIFTLKIEEIERRLATGEVDAEMELYFGEQLPELQQFARRAADSTRTVRGARPRALVLPGIMGSTLGYRRVLGLFHDTLWLDPLDTLFGRLKHLAVPSQKNHRARSLPDHLRWAPAATESGWLRRGVFSLRLAAEPQRSRRGAEGEARLDGAGQGASRGA
jgi:hypothetical protein